MGNNKDTRAWTWAKLAHNTGAYPSFQDSMKPSVELLLPLDETFV